VKRDDSNYTELKKRMLTMATINDQRCACVLEDAGWNQSKCQIHGADAPRFFVDHDVIHDRLTGRHVELPSPIDATTKHALSSAYHRPLPGQPELATDAYLLAVALCELASDGGASARVGWGVVAKVGPQLRALTEAVDEAIAAWDNSPTGSMSELVHQLSPHMQRLREIIARHLA